MYGKGGAGERRGDPATDGRSEEIRTEVCVCVWLCVCFEDGGKSLKLERSC